MTQNDLAPASAPEQGPDDPKCTVDNLVSILQQTMSGLTGPAQPKYLMGFNEPEDTHFDHKNTSPEKAVYHWRHFIQPAAIELNLDLVMPTVNNSFCKDHKYGCQYMGTWLANFLKKCYDARSDATSPCGVSKIRAISYHGYECGEDLWTH